LVNSPIPSIGFTIENAGRKMLTPYALYLPLSMGDVGLGK
jgi:hypothetical protein